MNRAETGALTAAILRRVRASPWLPTLRMGETETTGTAPTVVLAGESEARQANALGDPAGVGEQVWCILWLGNCLVLGRAGGSRLLGSATATGSDTFTASEVLDTLTVDVVVTQPGRKLRIEGRALCTVGTNGADVILRVSQDGSDIQRIAQHRFATASVAEYLTGFATVEDLSPGGYTFAITGQCVGGTGTFEGPTSTGEIVVTDIGQT